jgi:hypothetical protein
MAPSQPGAAVAGVQEELRQHSPEEFFQTSPEDDIQLLISPADTHPANNRADTAKTKDLVDFMGFLQLTCCRLSLDMGALDGVYIPRIMA